MSLYGGVYLVVGGVLDFTFEWEISINTPAAFQFLQKGSLRLSYTETRALSVTLATTTETFNAPTSLQGKAILVTNRTLNKTNNNSIDGFNAYRLYCSKYSRSTIFCHLWINEQDQGEIVFLAVATAFYVDSPSNAITIPPPASGANMFQGTLRRFLVALNRGTVYPISKH